MSDKSSVHSVAEEPEHIIKNENLSKDYVESDQNLQPDVAVQQISDEDEDSLDEKIRQEEDVICATDPSSEVTG